MAAFYDTHAHLDDPRFQEDFPLVIERAQAAGVTKIVSIGTDLESSRRVIALAEQYDCIFAVVGWHPSEAHEALDDIRPALRDLAKHPKVVALGETGLDYHRLPGRAGSPAHEPERPLTPPLSPNGGEGGLRPGEGAVREAKARMRSANPVPVPQWRDAHNVRALADDERYKQRQADLFRQHLEVAAETGLNVVIHQREAFDDTLALLRPFADKVRGVFHCFSETAERLHQLLELGSLVSFTGIVTFKNAPTLRDTVAAAPLDRFMLETDCPYLAPEPYRGKRCEPAYVKEIAQVVAQVKGCSLAELSAATCATAEKFFRKLKSSAGKKP
jgi:TatD DNase family protein